MSHDVVHDASRSRFVIDLGDGEAVLDYSRIDEGTLDFRSTRVPPEHRGEGIAGELVSHALDHARSQGQRIVPSCSYVDSYIQRHPEYADLVAGRG